MSKIVAVKFLGKSVPYARALQVQQHLVESRIAAETSAARRELDIILLLEHTPTYTAGRRIRDSYDTEGSRLRALGADYFETLRGGQTTFHGPGQLVGYPILNLKQHKINVRSYVEQLERFMIETCGQYGIQAGVTKDTGVWVGDRKIAALGIHVRHHITSHGFALNCNTDLAWFDHIVPCGIADKEVTSISRELKRQKQQGSTVKTTNITIHDAMPVAMDAFSSLFNVSLVPLEDASPEIDGEIARILAGDLKQ
ncbi:hypothetical protein BC831DRAFT_465675 [Entophlyctis helioformis]|nr:hypothetical protein BC831DRAFT_465675 [Entophlyctis helioformis]